MQPGKLLPLLVLLSACAAPRPVPPPAPPAPPPPPPFTYTVVWTREAGATLRPDSAGAPAPPLPNAFTRLEVLRSDSAAVYVRCVVCTPTKWEGWVNKDRVVFEPRTPALAANGDLAEFLLAVRAAAARRDVAALRPVMSRQFTHSLGGADGVVEALGRWEQEGFRRLDRLPFLLDRGVASPDGNVWAAPPAWVADRAYRDLRAGFRRENGRWEWIFLVPGPGES